MGAVGDEPCVVHIKVTGTIEYLDDNGQVTESANAEPSAPSTWPGAGSTTCTHPNGSSADPAASHRSHRHRNGDKP